MRVKGVGGWEGCSDGNYGGGVEGGRREVGREDGVEGGHI